MTVDPSQLHILHYPAAVLRQPTRPVERIDDEVRAVVDRMFDLMADAEGAGLAAPQVGLSWRLFVTAAHEGAPPRAFINPIISDMDPEAIMYDEGCLSLPNVRVDIRRPRAVTISALDRDGKPFTLRSEDFAARVWQHEYDHLQGVLIIDRMGPMDRLANRRAIRDLEAAMG